MAVITYEELQKRIDYLQQVNYDLPNAFYPTCFVKAGSDTIISNQVKWQKNLMNNVSPGVSIKKSLKKIVTEESSADLGNYILGSKENTAPLALFEKIEGDVLKFMKIPYSSKGGVLDTGVTNDLKLQDNRSVKMTFKVANNFDIYNQLLAWKENWASSDLNHRYLKSRKEKSNDAISEGYFGLSYVHIKSDGSMIPTAHLALFGLIPVDINFANGGIGPSVSPTPFKITVTCTVASGLFLIALNDENYTYFTLT